MEAVENAKGSCLQTNSTECEGVAGAQSAVQPEQGEAEGRSRYRPGRSAQDAIFKIRGYAEEGYEFGVLLGKDELHHRLHRTRPAEHIDALYLFGFIAAFGEDLRIAGERGRAAGDVDHAARRG